MGLIFQGVIAAIEPYRTVAMHSRGSPDAERSSESARFSPPAWRNTSGTALFGQQIQEERHHVRSARPVRRSAARHAPAGDRRRPGIGRAVADAYAARGARVCILDRVPVSDAPKDWICLEGSVASAADAERAFTEMDRAWGGVDVAHANAGMSQNKATLELTEAEWRQVLDVNLTGVFLTAQSAGRRMVAQGSGLILATSSIYGLTAAPDRIAYTATKGAVSQIVRTLASEWGPQWRARQRDCAGVCADGDGRGADPAGAARPRPADGAHHAGALRPACRYRRHGVFSRLAGSVLDQRRDHVG